MLSQYKGLNCRKNTVHILAHKLSSNNTKPNKGEQLGTTPPKDKGWNKQTMGARNKQTTFSRGWNSHCVRGCHSRCERGCDPRWSGGARRCNSRCDPTDAQQLVGRGRAHPQPITWLMVHLTSTHIRRTNTTFDNSTNHSWSPWSHCNVCSTHVWCHIS